MQESAHSEGDCSIELDIGVLRIAHVAISFLISELFSELRSLDRALASTAFMSGGSRSQNFSMSSHDIARRAAGHNAYNTPARNPAAPLRQGGLATPVSLFAVLRPVAHAAVRLRFGRGIVRKTIDLT